MAAPGQLRIAAAQYPVERPADTAALKAKLARWVGEAAQARAELLVLPEYGLMEIAGTCEDRIAGDLALSLDAVCRLRPEIDAHLGELARRHRLHILGPSGPSRRADGSIANVAKLATPQGRLGAIEKIIMTPFERDWGVTGGGEPIVLETAIGRIGVLICYDSEFPLLARAMADAGARLILIPTCTERLSGHNRVRTAALARALESTIATVASPTVGAAPWSPAIDRNTGAAGIFVPAESGVSDTGVIAEGRLDVPGLVVGEVDLERLGRVRAAGEMRNAADWRLQPGAEAAHKPARVVDLR